MKTYLSFLKLLLCIIWLCLPFFISSLAIGILSIVLFVESLRVFALKKIDYNPFKIVIAFALLMLILFLLSGTDNTSIWYLSEPLLRIMGYVMVGLYIGYYLTPTDVLLVMKFFRFSQTSVKSIVLFLNFIPLAVAQLKKIVMAQKARGLHIGIRGFFQNNTYLFILVPYITYILKRATFAHLLIVTRELNTPHGRPNIGVKEGIILGITVLLLFL